MSVCLSLSPSLSQLCVCLYLNVRVSLCECVRERVWVARVHVPLLRTCKGENE